MVSREEAKQKIKEVIEKYESVCNDKREQDYKGEDNTVDAFIKPILKALGYQKVPSELDNQFPIRHPSGVGKADLALKIDGKVKILVENKPLTTKDLENETSTTSDGHKRTYLEQLINYAFDINKNTKEQVDFCILTNGKEWRVYYTRFYGVSFDRKLLWAINLPQLALDEKFERLWWLSKEELAKKTIYEHLREDKRLKVDEDVVNDLLYCKSLLIDSVFKDYKEGKRNVKEKIDKLLKEEPYKDMEKEIALAELVKEATGNVLNKILFVRIIEDKGLLIPKLTTEKIRQWKTIAKKFENVMEIYRTACEEAEDEYNGGAFRLNEHDEIDYDTNVLEKIIEIIDGYKFDEIGSDIVGSIYEKYLGSVLKEESEKGKIKLKVSRDERRELGQYYTPKYVVDYIVENTLGELLKKASLKKISNIKVLDPACGSGSFLISAYDKIEEIYNEHNKEEESKAREQMVETKNGKNTSISAFTNANIIPDIKNKILMENIYGVDLNNLSVEIAEMNLWLRALEKGKKLARLDKNIKSGNSLIEEDELSKKLFGKHLEEYKPFNWEQEFEEIMQSGGFDIVIGNPPYIDYREIQGNDYFKKKYFCATAENLTLRYNILILFFEKGIKLLKEGGRLGFIVSNQFLCSDFGLKIRELILKECSIEQIIDLSNLRVFKDAATYPIIIIFKKEKKPDNEIKIAKIRDEGELIEKKLSFNEVSQKFFEKTESNIFILDIDKETINLVNKLNKNAEALGKLAELSWGTSAAGYSKLKIDETKYNSLGKNKQKDFLPLIQTADIERHWIDWQKEYMPKSLYSKNKIMAFEKKKIVIGRLNKFLKAAIDENKFSLGKATYLIDSKLKLEYLSAILNSKLIDYYYKFFFKSTHMQGGYVRYDVPYLERLPIHIPTDKEVDQITEKVKIIQYLKEKTGRLNEIFDKSIKTFSEGKSESANLEGYVSDYYKEALNNSNEIKAKITELKVRSEGEELIVFADYVKGDETFDNVDLFKVKIDDDFMREFLYLAIRRYANKKRGFSENVLLKEINRIKIPLFYSSPLTIGNKERIQKVIENFKKGSKGLLKKVDSKVHYSSVNEIEEDIERTDKELDELVYDLYGLTVKERKIIDPEYEPIEGKDYSKF